MRAMRIEREGLKGLTREERIRASLLRAGDILHPNMVREAFGAMPRSPIALETGMHSTRVSRLLSEFGYDVIVAHARTVSLIGERGKREQGARPDHRAAARRYDFHCSEAR